MRKFLLCAVIALMSITTMSAATRIEEYIYTSTVTGVTFHVPSNVKELQDNENGVVLQTPDKEYTITAEAFDISEVSQEEISNHIAFMAEKAKIDLNKSQHIENKTEATTLIGEIINYANNGGAAVGVVQINNTDLGYYITIVTSPKYSDFAASSLTTVGFDPDAVDD